MTRSEINARVAALVERSRDRRHAVSLPRRLRALHLAVDTAAVDGGEAQVPALPPSTLLAPLP